MSLKRLEIDYSAFLNKKFFVKNFAWSASSQVGTLLGVLKLPSDIILANYFLSIPFTTAAYFRAKMRVILQTAGTIQHQGILLADANVPQSDSSTVSFVNFNYHLCAPHVFLKACESTPASLPAPMYVNTKLAQTASDADTVLFLPDTTKGDVCEVRLVVVSPLAMPSGSSTLVTVSAHVMFEELEFFVPKTVSSWIPIGPAVFPKSPATSKPASVLNHKKLTTQGLAAVTSGVIDSVFSLGKKYTGDILDAARSIIREYTGLHSPNQPVIAEKDYVVKRNNPNLADSPSCSELLDAYGGFQHGISDTYYFKTDVDEMAVSHILSKPQYIGTFNVKATGESGDLLWSRPIYPLQESHEFLTSVLSKIALMSTHWSGDMEIILQPSKNMFQFFKLQVVKMYNSDKRALTSYPRMTDVTGLMVDTMEFSGQEVRTVDLPYMSPMVSCPVSSDYALIPSLHGMYYIYLLQPPAVGDNVPAIIPVNVYLRCKPNFQLYGTAQRAFTPYPYPLLASKDGQAPFIASEEKERVRKLRIKSYIPKKLNTQSTAIIDNVESQVPACDTEVPKPDIVAIRPLVHLRDICRRMFTFVTSRELHPDTTQVLEFDLARLIGGNGLPYNYNFSPSLVLRKMFYGFRGGLRLKIKIIGASNAKATYVPPYANYDNAVKSFMAAVPIAYSDPLYDAETIKAFGYDPHKGFMTCHQEATNYHVSNTDLGNPGDVRGLSTTILDVEVPYTHAYDFVGSANVTDTVKFSEYYADTLGHLVIAVEPAIVFDPMTAPRGLTRTSEYSVEVYAAYDDSARLGMQVFNEVVALAFFPTTHGNVQFSPFNKLTGQEMSTIPSIDAPAAYYTSL